LVAIYRAGFTHFFGCHL